MGKRQGRGFTLIELLVVIGIISILLLMEIIVLNPGEILRQARDTSRISDLASLRGAVALYLANDSSESQIGINADCYVSIPDGQNLPSSPSGTSCGGRFESGATETQVLPGNLWNADGSGWLPVDFALLKSGSPVVKLPVDPVNAVTGATSTSYFYAYRPGPAGCSGTGCAEFEFNAHMESIKYQHGGSADVESTDGGNEKGYYETGTSVGLRL